MALSPIDEPFYFVGEFVANVWLLWFCYIWLDLGYMD